MKRDVELFDSSRMRQHDVLDAAPFWGKGSSKKSPSQLQWVDLQGRICTTMPFDGNSAIIFKNCVFTFSDLLHTQL